MRLCRFVVVLFVGALVGCEAQPQFALDVVRRDAGAESAVDGSVGDTGAQAVDAVEPREVAAIDVVPRSRGNVRVLITADNAYGFGYGSASSVMNYFGGIENSTAGMIFSCPVGNGPEQYLVPAAEAPDGSYLYIVTWSDQSTTQGVLGQFQREGSTEVLYTGDARFEVCATGMPFDVGSRGPSMAIINQQIQRCNAGGGDATTTSRGWVNAMGTAAGALAVGEDNTTDRTSVTAGNEFPIVCAIDMRARWMWFNWDPTTLRWPTMGSPFIYPSSATRPNPTKQFLLFRLGTQDIPG